ARRDCGQSPWRAAWRTPTRKRWRRSRLCFLERNPRSPLRGRPRHAHAHRVAGVDLSGKDGFGERRLDQAAQSGAHRARAQLAIKTAVCQKISDGAIVELEADAALALEALRGRPRQPARDFCDFGGAERREDQWLLDAVPKLDREGAARGREYLGGAPG